MAALINNCACPICRSAGDHPDKVRHHQINLLLSLMDARQRRLFAAYEVQRLGYGGISQMALITGMDRKTIRRGLSELCGRKEK